MNIHKKYESSIYNNVVLSTEEKQELARNIKEDFNEQSYEKLCQYIAQTSATSIVDPKDIENALTYLDAKVTSARKTLSSYDAFKITDSVDDEQEITTKYAALSENSGLIINIDTTFNGMSFSAGDILFKDYYGTMRKIANSVRGYYEPSKITYDKDTEYYTLQYSFKNGIAAEDSTTSITFPPSPTEPATSIYNISQQLKSGEFESGGLIKSQTTPSKIIYPVWEIRMYNESKIGERIFNAVTITYDKSQSTYKIKNNTNVCLWVMAK